MRRHHPGLVDLFREAAELTCLCHLPAVTVTGDRGGVVPEGRVPGRSDLGLTGGDWNEMLDAGSGGAGRGKGGYLRLSAWPQGCPK